MNPPAGSTAASGHAADPAADANPAWQQFWSTGAVDTFGSTAEAILAPAGERSPPLVAHWRTWMRGLPAAGELLDIATGNGVVLSHLVVARQEPSWRGLGVDLSQPSPFWLGAVDASQRERITVQGQVSAESLPFASERFAAVTSQFGIEYADLARAVPEAARVLRPGGTIGWVMHHAQGRPAALATEELAHLEWLEQVGWFDTISRAVEASGVAIAPGGVAQVQLASKGAAMRAELDRLGQALKVRIAQSSCPDLLIDVGSLTAHSLGMANHQRGAAAMTRASQFRVALSENRARLEDLLAHALDESAWRRLLEEITAQGIRQSADAGPLLDRGHLMGWWLHGTRV